MEALANQMHGLEDEARLSVQGMLPSLNAVSSHGSELTTPIGDSSELTNSIVRVNQIASRKKVATFDSPENELDGGSADESDEEKFFDAPEVSVQESIAPAELPSILQKPMEEFAVGHRRNISTASVNDTSFMKSTPDADVKQKFPQISSDRRMAVSVLIILRVMFVLMWC